MILNKSAATTQTVLLKYPYVFLRRWTWPSHIEHLLERTITEWPESTLEEQHDNGGDHIALRLCWLIVVHPETPSAVLDLFAGLNITDFQVRVAENPNTQATTLARLAQHASPAVRTAVAENRNADSETFYMLSKDESADVRYTIAESPCHAWSILSCLADDDNSYVSARAKKTLARICDPLSK